MVMTNIVTGNNRVFQRLWGKIVTLKDTKYEETSNKQHLSTSSLSFPNTDHRKKEKIDEKNYLVTVRNRLNSHT